MTYFKTWISIVSILASLSSSAQTAHTNVEIARIKKAGSAMELVYSRNADKMIFTVKDRDVSYEIKTLKVDLSSRNVAIAGDRDTYNFEILKKGANMSGDAYKWCFTSRVEVDYGEYLPPFAAGLYPLVFPIVGTTALCAAVPAVPMIVGVLVLPVDVVITIGDKISGIFDTEAIAARKFAKLINAKNSKASAKVFNELVEQIQAL